MLHAASSRIANARSSVDVEIVGTGEDAMPYTAIDNLPPVHPGEILKDELEALNMSARKFAEHIRVPPNAVAAILNGGRGVTAQMALRFGQAFGTGPGYWMRLQNIYEEKRARSELAGELEQIAGLL
ncbi:MAG: HigA family addiction module antitoxin [Rhodomicrobium sp.]